jgi:uncharacterized protein YbgA (DUF1722 family)
MTVQKRETDTSKQAKTKFCKQLHSVMISTAQMCTHTNLYLHICVMCFKELVNLDSEQRTRFHAHISISSEASKLLLARLFDWLQLAEHMYV